MALASPSVCNKHGCGNTTYGRYCDKHAYLARQYRKRPDNRPSASARGYDAKWRALRMAFIRENPTCKHCEQRGRINPAREVDHIMPHAGLTDPLRLEWTNLQSLCRACHARKTASEAR